MHSINSAASNVRNRIEWADFAKGMCIIWVVALYATDFVQQSTGRMGWMQDVADFARPFRMPDFFLISGLFVPRVLNRSWRTYLDSKVLYFLYFYTIWATFKFLNMHAGDFAAVGVVGLVREYARLFIEPPTGPLWFIYTLGVFFLVIRLARGVPALLVLAVAAALQVADLHTGIKVFDKFAQYFVYFYAGYLFSRQIFHIAEWAHAYPRRTAAFLAGWLIVNVAMVLTGWAWLPGVSLALGFAGAMAVMFLATLLTRAKSAEWLKYMGRHSLVVYLGFVVPLGLMRRFIVSPHMPLDIGSLSLLAAILSVAGALAMYLLVRNTPLRFLFARPEWLSIQRRPEGGAVKSAATT